jgi:hypothetical protein
MKISKSLNLTALFLFYIAIPVIGNCQIYTLSTPISGYLTMSIWDTNGPAGSSGGFYFNFTNLTETVYLDPTNQTIRQVGVIFGTPSALQISITETQSIPGQFPNPPTNVSGSVTVTLALTSGALSFDTGPRPLSWNAALGVYTCDAHLTDIFDCVGTYSLVTGGQTYSGSFFYTLPFYTGWGGIFIAGTFSELSTTDYPNSLTLSDLFGGPLCCGGYCLLPASPSVVADIVANNGFHAGLSVGSRVSHGVYETFPLSEQFVWASPGTATATLVPTTNSPAITNQPQSVLVHAHNTASFNVAVSGTIPLSYQWSLNSTNISGATLTSLTIANVVQTNLGAYSVVVTNGVGSVTSSNAMLSMYPFVASPFVGAVTYWGKPASFGIEAWGTGPLSYQWFKDGVAILNVNTQTLSFTSIQATNAGLYSVVVTSPLGSVTNAPAQVIVYPAGVSLGFCPSVTISGVIGYSYIIERTADLTNTNSWVTLTNLTLALPVQLWVDTNVDATSPSYSKYFYRVLPGQ